MGPRAPLAVSSMVTRFVTATLVVVASAGCASRLSDETPAGALQLFLAAMDESEHDATALSRAYELLAPESRRALERRAKLATTLARRDFAPWEMIAQGRYRLRFVPRRQHGFVEHASGDRVEVEVIGERPGERAVVPMVREGTHYRVLLEIPSLDRGASPRSEDGGAPTGE